MAAQLTGIWNQLSAAHSLTKTQPLDSSSTGTSGTSDDDSATISANDFLTLLVTEMQNQDPTADTDPNEYINQLVQVNSLEQLISINQTLTTDSAATPSGGAVKAQASPPGSTTPALPHLADGNLSVPANNPAAQRVADSLTTRSNEL
jgi:flagellar basal-body rod modification protein FlgD